MNNAELLKEMAPELTGDTYRRRMHFPGRRSGWPAAAISQAHAG
jgi:hypothetical protein